MIRTNRVSGQPAPPQSPSDGNGSNDPPSKFNVVGAGWGADRQWILLRAIWRSPLTATQKVVLGVIADQARMGDGIAPIGYSTLCALCGTGRRNALKIVKELAEGGWIIVGRFDADHGGRCSNEYALGSRLEQAVRDQIAFEAEQRHQQAKDAVLEKMHDGWYYEDLDEREQALHDELVRESRQRLQGGGL
jgi:hypothetical protein